jgi:secretion/DNA translocation related CpaE-like protein
VVPSQPVAEALTMTSPALLITRDDLLLDDLLRLAAAAGTTLDVAHDTTAALRGWGAASVVLLGADLADPVAAQHPPRRDQVHVVAHGPVPDRLFRAALATGALDVVELPAADAWLVELLTDSVDGGAHPARTVGVVGGSGGAGATTFASALALTAAASGPAVLLDLDPLGPGADRVVGLDADGGPDGGDGRSAGGGGGARWDALVGSHGRLGSRSLRAALPHRDGLAVLTWPVGPPVDLDPTTAREVLSAAQRGHDVVVADLPRHLDPVSLEVASRCDRVLLVAEPSVAGVASAGKVAAGLRTVNDDLGVVVRVGRAAVPAGHVAGVLELPLVAELAAQRRLDEHLDLGLGPVHTRRCPLARAARAALDDLAHRSRAGAVA